MSKPHWLFALGYVQGTHYIWFLLEFIQMEIPLRNFVRSAEGVCAVCVIIAHQEQTIVFGCLLYLVYCVLRYKSYCVLYMYYCILVYLCICVVVFGHQGSAQQAAMSKDSRAKAISLLIQQRNVTPAKSIENKLPSKLERNSQSLLSFSS